MLFGYEQFQREEIPKVFFTVVCPLCDLLVPTLEAMIRISYINPIAPDLQISNRKTP